MIDFSFDVFSFIKKKSKVYLLIKCRLKLIPRKMIVNSYFFMTKKDMNRFKNNLSFIFIKHFVLRQFDLGKAFLKKLKSSVR